MKCLERNREIISSAFISALQKQSGVDISVYGLSMFPYYLPGDKVRVQKIRCELLKVGDVIVFIKNKKLIAHRLLKIDSTKKRLISKGDALIQKDSLISFDHFLGVVVLHSRNGKYIKWINKPLIKRMIAFTSPLMGVLFFYMSRVWNKLKK